MVPSTNTAISLAASTGLMRTLMQSNPLATSNSIDLTSMMMRSSPSPPAWVKRVALLPDSALDEVPPVSVAWSMLTVTCPPAWMSPTLTMTTARWKLASDTKPLLTSAAKESAGSWART